MSGWWPVLTLLALALTSGCAAVPLGDQSGPAPGDVFAHGSSLPLTPLEIEARLGEIQVLVVGETHDHPGHHQVQLDLLKGMEQAGRPLVVGVEWLDHTAQPACDRLSSGQVTVEEFARLVDWENKWGFPLALYAPILERVRERRHRLVALNAPLEAVRQVGRGGLGSLSQAQRALLAPALDLEDPAYRAQLAAQFSGHGVRGAAQEENFFAAQVARDDTMAHHLAQAMHPWPDGGGRAVVLAGGGHLAHGQGLPPRIARRLPGARLATAWPVSAEAAASLTGLAGGAWPADLLVVSAPAPPRPPRLGVVLKAEDGGLRVLRVLTSGSADRAGWQAGDLLVAVDGTPLKQIKQIHDLIKDAPLETHRYLLMRDGREVESVITLEGQGR